MRAALAHVDHHFLACVSRPWHPDRLGRIPEGEALLADWGDGTNLPLRLSAHIDHFETREIVQESKLKGEYCDVDLIMKYANCVSGAS